MSTVGFAVMDRSSEINAITLLCTDMQQSVEFYERLGLVVEYGGRTEPFTSLRHGHNFVNLTTMEGPPSGFWGRVILHVPDPDAVHRVAIEAGYRPLMAPSDAPWGERYFHIRDPDGHEISFSRLLDP